MLSHSGLELYEHVYSLGRGYNCIGACMFSEPGVGTKKRPCMFFEAGVGT